FGFDNDSLDVFRETLSFIEKSGMEFAQFSLLTPLPGTALFRQFEEEQRIVHRDWSKYDLGSIVFQHPLSVPSDSISKRTMRGGAFIQSAPSRSVWACRRAGAISSSGSRTWQW